MKYLVPIAAVIFSVSFVSIPLVWSDGPFEMGEYQAQEEYEHRMPGYRGFIRENGEHDIKIPGYGRWDD